MTEIRLGSYIITIGVDHCDTDDIGVSNLDLLEAIESLKGDLMSQADELQVVLSDLTDAVDAQSSVVDSVDAKLVELEAAVTDGGAVEPLIGQLRSQVDELKGNTERLSSALPTELPTGGDTTDTTGGDTTPPAPGSTGDTTGGTGGDTVPSTPPADGTGTDAGPVDPSAPTDGGVDSSPETFGSTH
jgi:hypothetical protein